MAKAVVKKVKSKALTKRKSSRGFPMVKTEDGHWTTCTPELADQVCDSLSDGAHITTALSALGFPKATFEGWLKTADKNDAEGKDGTLFQQFRDKVVSAFSQAEICLLREIRSATPNRSQWQNLAWILERTRFADYGLKQEVNIEVNMPGPQLPPDPPKSHAEWLRRKDERDKIQREAVDTTFREVTDEG